MSETLSEKTSAHRPRTAVVIVAAGSGTRLGYGMPKALVPLAGRPLLAHAIEGVLASGVASRIVVVLPRGDTELEDVCRAYARRPGEPGAVASRPEIVLAVGGDSRSDSVRSGLAAVGPEADFVLVHDAARCLAPPEVFAGVVGALEAGAVAVVPAVPVVDTVKTVVPARRPEIAPETVDSTPARSGLRAVQTPQGFRRQALLDAHAAAAGWEGARAEAVTDDAMLMELSGVEVHVVPGSVQALKITTPLDMLLAEALVANGYEEQL